MIYVVEDDDNIRELVCYTLNNSGLLAEGFARPSDFWAAVEARLPRLVLLDIMLPEQDGMEILRRLRSENVTRRVPVMMLTAKDTEYDKVLALDNGADDYLSKPFGIMELLARVRALLRRSENAMLTIDYTLGNLYVCPSKHIVQVDGQDVSLTLKEFQLLCMLLAQPDIVVSRGEILDSVWGYSFDSESRTVDVHIRTLRQKLGSAGDLIETVRGMGYKIRSEQHE